MAVVGLIGGAVSAIGSIFSGNAQAAAYNYQAQIAQMNAGIANQNAGFERALGQTQQVQEGMKIKAQIGQARAAQGAGGLDVQSGTNVEVRESMDQIGKIDQGNIIFNANRRAYGDEVEAVQDIAQANLDRMAASTAKTAGTIGAFTSILGGGSSFIDKWNAGKAAGLSNNDTMFGGNILGGLFGG